MPKPYAQTCRNLCAVTLHASALHVSADGLRLIGTSESDEGESWPKIPPPRVGADCVAETREQHAFAGKKNGKETIFPL